jgi:hypothetical protein
MKTYSGFLNKNNVPENGVFVFGSNTVCINGNPSKGTGGAALVAHLEFGVGLRENMANRLSDSGKAYGIVTVMAPKKFISENNIKENIKLFYIFANNNIDKLFYVAYDGINPNATSLNGKSRVTLAKLFLEAGEIPNNVIFEENFYKLIFNTRGFKI